MFGLMSPEPAASETDYANQLSVSAVAERSELRPLGYRLLLLLLLMSLAPRAFMLLKTQAICSDGPFYIGLAKSLERGDLTGGLLEVNLNTLPSLLVLLHWMGIEWEWAGRLLSVAASSLVVLPLFGFVRRQFDERVAAVACFLYATHPLLIEDSHELLRDPLFWFAFVLALYLSWLAVTEIRIVYFLASGLAIVFAALTRVEGALLLIPVVCWSFTRYRNLKESRSRLILGTALCVFLGPLLVLVVNMTVLKNHPQWESLRVRPFLLLGAWFRTQVLSADASSLATSMLPHLSLPQRLWIWVHTMERGLSPIFAVLMFGGIWKWRHVWFRADHRPLFYVSLMIMLGIWVHLWFAGVSSYRYPLPIVLMGTPFAALGLFGLVALVTGIADRRNWKAGLRTTAVVGVYLLIGGIGLADALTRNYDAREARVALGRMIHQEFGPKPRIVGRDGIARLIGYYAQGEWYEYAPDASPDSVVAMVDQASPDVVLVSLYGRDREKYSSVITALEAHGFQQIPRTSLPTGIKDAILLKAGGSK